MIVDNDQKKVKKYFEKNQNHLKIEKLQWKMGKE